MASAKISALGAGGAAQAGDELPAARAGANVKVTAAAIAALGGAAWTSMAAGSGVAQTDNGDSSIVYRLAQTTADRISWRVTESVASVSTGSPVLFQIDTLAASTAIPLLVKSRGNEVFRVSASEAKLLFPAAGATPQLCSVGFTTSGIALDENTIRFLVSSTQKMLIDGNGISVGTPLRMGASAGAPDIFLERDAANVLAQRNGTNAQALRVYNTFTDAANYERGSLAWESNSLVLRTAGAGTGASNRSIKLVTTGNLNLDVANVTTAGHVLFSNDNGNDIGAAGATRPRDVHVGRDVVLARWLQQAEVAADPVAGDLAADAEVAIYNKNDKFVIAYNNGGTMTYITIPLDGASTAWSHGTTAP